MPGSTPLAALRATLVTVVLLVPAIAFPALVEAQETAPSVADVTSAYRQSPRCDTRAGTKAASDAPAPRVTLVGNSIAEELIPCLRTILERRGGSLSPVVANSVPLCPLQDGIRRQLRRPEGADRRQPSSSGTRLRATTGPAGTRR